MLSKPLYDVVNVRNCGMTARDGVWLATDIWRPARDGEPLPGPFPVILLRTPYNRARPAHQEICEFFTSFGFLAAIQDCRGRYGSEGDFVLLSNEGPDGYDAIEWLASLPYCDGNVGTFGTSYLAWVQNAAAIERPPHLRAMWVNQGGANGNTATLRHNGAMELRWLTWAITYGTMSREAQCNPALQADLTRAGEQTYEWLTRLPWHEGNSPLAGLPGYERWAKDLYEHGDADEFWQQPGLNFAAHYDRTADVPTMYAGSWYDSYSRATVENYQALSSRLSKQSLLMGAWTHGEKTMDTRVAGDVDLGPGMPIAGNLATDFKHLMLRWFNHHLYGAGNGVDADPPVHLFVMGGGSGSRTAEGRLAHGGRWRTEHSWPLERAVSTRLFLAEDGRLAATSPTVPGKITARFDPANPLPTISANISSLNEILPAPARFTPDAPNSMTRLMVVQGGADQRTRPDLHGCAPPYAPIESRPDALLFATDPLDQPLEVTGPITTTIYLSSNAPDTDLFVMLQDYYPPSSDWPDGFRLNIADGILRMRYRDGMDRPQLMEHGRVYRAVVPLFPTSNLFASGHRIRLLVSFSSFPRFDVNPNTGEPIGRHRSTRVATNTIHLSPEHSSSIELPLVPA